MMQRTKPKKSERGMALLMVIWMVVLLTSIASEYAIHMRTDLMLTESLKEETEAYYMALAGYHAALAELMEPIQSQMMSSDGQVIFGWEAGQSPDAPVPLPPPIERSSTMDTGSFTYDIRDEQGLFPLNSLLNAVAANPQSGTPSPLDGFRELLRQSGVTDEVQLSTIIDSIVDWMDVGDEHMPNGAEDDWYEKNYAEQGMQYPYESPDARRIFTLDELLLIRGMTSEILYGSAAVRNASVLGSEEEQPATLSGPYLGIYSHVSAHSRGQRPMNKMTADPLVLAMYFPQEFDQVMSAREAGLPLAGATQPSRFFSIVSTGRSLSGKTHHTIRAWIQRMDRGATGAQLIVAEWNDNYLLETLSAPQPIN